MISKRMNGYLGQGSWIRRMFEAGGEMIAKYGPEAVCDFSLGNPDLPAPPAVASALHELALGADKAYAFGYMPNAGYPEARAAVARLVENEQGVAVESQDVLMTCGASGGLNVFFRTVLEPEDEVLCPAPYFVEYGFYVQNYGGVLKPVPSQAHSFALDLPAIEAAIGPKTRAMLINSPNNPSGAVYPREDLQNLAGLLAKAGQKYGRPIYLLSDEPYRFLTFDEVEVPSVLELYPWSVCVSSFSKTLGLAGERVGYIALAPQMPQKDLLMQGLILANRILGFVNAPAIGQKLIMAVGENQVDVSIYERRRKTMNDMLTEAGYSFTPPKGTFYFFPGVPESYNGDDVAFTQRLIKEKILAVPGSGFGYPGFFRLAFCVDEKIIRKAGEGFARALRG